MSHRRAANWGGDIVSLGTAALEAGDKAARERLAGLDSVDPNQPFFIFSHNGLCISDLLTDWDSRLAGRANERQPSMNNLTLLKVRLLSGGVAVCTYTMGRVAALHGLLERVEHASFPVCLKRIAVSLRIPVFHLHNLGFKLAFAGNCRRMLLLERHHAALRSYYLRLKRDQLPAELVQVPSSHQPR